jgi:hypothetical protein
MEMRDKVLMKLFDKSETPQRNSNQDKDATLFMIKSDKYDLFFNQFWKWKNKEENSLNEKLKSLILLPKVTKHGLKHHYTLGTTLQV